MQIQLTNLYVNLLEQLYIYRILVPLAIWFIPTNLSLLAILISITSVTWLNGFLFVCGRISLIFIKNILLASVVCVAAVESGACNLKQLKQFFGSLAGFVRKLGTRFLTRIQSLHYVRTRSLTLILITFTVPIFLKKGFFGSNNYFALLFGADQRYWIPLVAFCCLFIGGFYRLSLYDYKGHSYWTRVTVLASKVCVNMITLKIACYYAMVFYMSTCSEAECQGLNPLIGTFVTGLAIGTIATATVTNYNHAQTLALKEQEFRHSLALKDKDTERALALKDRELQGAVALKSEELKLVVVLKDKELERALALKDRELQGAVALKSEELKLVVAAKDKAVEQANKEVGTLLGGKEMEIGAKNKEIQGIRQLNQELLQSNTAKDKIIKEGYISAKALEAKVDSNNAKVTSYETKLGKCVEMVTAQGNEIKQLRGDLVATTNRVQAVEKVVPDLRQKFVKLDHLADIVEKLQQIQE